VFEPKELDIMRREPRDPDVPILTGRLQLRILLVSMMLLLGCYVLFQHEQTLGSSLAEARTVAVNVFVMVELFYLFNCRSFTRSMFSIGLFSNPWVIAGSLAMIALQLLYTYAPWMNSVFQSAPISTGAWLRIIGVALGVYVVIGLEKALTRRMRGRKAVLPAKL